MITVLVVLPYSVKERITGVEIRYTKFQKYIDKDTFNYNIFYINSRTDITKIKDIYSHIDILHCIDSNYFPECLMLRSHYNCKIIYSLEEDDPNVQTLSNLYSSDANIFASNFMLQKYKSYGFKNYFVFNGVDSIPDDQLRYSVEDKSVYRGVFVGRLDPKTKNCLSLFDINVEGVEIDYVGSNPMKFHFEPHSRYLGIIENSILQHVMRNYDFVIAPSISEPFGIICLESLNNGVPLLASFVDGMKDYLTDDVALNCGVERVSIIKCLEKFKKLTKQDKLSYILKGRELCKLYTWDIIVKKLELIYKEVLSWH